MSYYDYQDLLRAADEEGTPDTLNALADWFERYGMDFWNGECWTIDKTRSLYPIYFYDPDDPLYNPDNPQLWGYEIR